MKFCRMTIWSGRENKLNLNFMTDYKCKGKGLPQQAEVVQGVRVG